jgi:hypothetical protein
MINQKAREIAERAFDSTASYPEKRFQAARLGIIEGLEMAIKALQDDAKLCDCSAWEEGECACGAWCEWKTIPSHRAVEIVRALIEEQKV